jgi:hypothetical protein
MHGAITHENCWLNGMQMGTRTQIADGNTPVSSTQIAGRMECRWVPEPKLLAEWNADGNTPVSSPPMMPRRGYPVFDPSAPLSVLYRTILSQSRAARAALGVCPVRTPELLEVPGDSISMSGGSDVGSRVTDVGKLAGRVTAIILARQQISPNDALDVRISCSYSLHDHPHSLL